MVRIGKVPRVLLGGWIAGLVTGLMVAIVLVRWPDLRLGWLAVIGFIAFGILWNVLDVVIDVVDGWLRRATGDEPGRRTTKGG